MKTFIIITTLLISHTVLAQNHINLKNGYAVNGYDVISYFENKAEKGIAEYTAIYENVKYKFSSKKHLESFLSNSEKYIPKYGGYCAYAISKDGEKVSVNPKTFLISDGKLYLFYNKWGNNTLKKWKDENPEILILKANENWKKIIDN